MTTCSESFFTKSILTEIFSEVFNLFLNFMMNLFMMNELTKVGIDWDDDNDLVIKYIDKFGDPYDNIKKLK